MMATEYTKSAIHERVSAILTSTTCSQFRLQEVVKRLSVDTGCWLQQIDVSQTDAVAGCSTFTAHAVLLYPAAVVGDVVVP